MTKQEMTLKSIPKSTIVWAVVICAVLLLALYRLGVLLSDKGKAEKTSVGPVAATPAPVVAEEVAKASTAEPAFYEYTVKKGDTLSELSEEFYENWVLYPQIARDNGVKDPNVIFPGQKLRLKKTLTTPHGQNVSATDRLRSEFQARYQ